MISLPVARLVLNAAASIGVSRVVNDIIRNNTNVVTTADSVKVWTGAIVIGSMVADRAMDHVNETIDGVVAWNEKRKGGDLGDKLADNVENIANKVEDKFKSEKPPERPDSP